MKKPILLVVLLLFAASIVCAQEDFSYQHFHESMQFLVTTIPYGSISNTDLWDIADMDEARDLDTNNDGWLIIRISETVSTWGFVMLHIRSRNYVFITLSIEPNHLSTIDQSEGRGYNFANASQRTAFLNEINAIKTRFENMAVQPTETRPSGTTNPSNTNQITIVNNTGYTVYYVYISPSTDTSWGSDRLDNNQTLRNGQSAALNLPYPISQVDRYDIRLVDSDDDTYTKRNVRVSANSRIVFTFDDLD